MNSYDVIVVGAGNAGFCAAHAARERGARVLILEKAPQAWVGGNSYFTAGAFRTTYDDLGELLPILEDLSEELASLTDLPSYRVEDFVADLQRVTDGRCDERLASILVEDSADTIRWLHAQGLRWRLMYDRQSFQINGRYRFWGGLALGVVGGGQGLIEQHAQAADCSGIEIRYESAMTALVTGENGRVTGVICESPTGRTEISAGAVVLASGGFEADPQMRALYLGPNWDLAKVRGTPYNTGEGIRIAMDLDAQPCGHWSGCHSIAWDAGSPASGNRELTNLYSKQSYPLGIVVNRDANRFIDEGADFRNYTYAKYGAEILKQPGAVAWQLYDAKTAPLLRQDEYTVNGVSRTEARDIRELATLLDLDPDVLEFTVNTFNAAATNIAFNPAVKDGKRTEGIVPPKSNWALPLDTPPYLAFEVTCGITFTYGGLKIDDCARVLNRRDAPIPGLHAAGELVGGLFYHNYPGGSGLMAGSVFGRRAGAEAARFAHL